MIVTDEMVERVAKAIREILNMPSVSHSAAALARAAIEAALSRKGKK